MKIIEHICEGDVCYSFPYPKEELLFFDIETTGFSAKTSALYLIGVQFYREGVWKQLQWFADDNKSEVSILTAFFSFMKNFKYLIHFNGNGFDIPFLQKKCSAHNLTDNLYSFEHIESFDIYKTLFPFRKQLNIENLKQKTLEHFWNINRKDLYNGGELIAFYQNYLKLKRAGDNKDATDLEAFLLLHNQEDLAGMLQFSNILYLADLLSGNLSFSNTTAGVHQDKLLELHALLPNSFPVSLSYTGEQAFLSIEKNELNLVVPIYHTELKFFYENYKEYYYLPMEDTAIHKSVASYVDKNYRERAKKQNCYVRKSGNFLRDYNSTITPKFKNSYEEDTTYLMLTDEFLSSSEIQTQFIQSFFLHCTDYLLTKSNY